MKYKILLIEEISILKTLFSNLFTKHGYDVQSADGPKEGLKMAKVMSFDLVFCDLRTSGGEAPSFLSILKNDERIKDIPIFVISNDSLGALRVETRFVDAYLNKPVQPGIIIEKLKTLLPEENQGIMESREKLESFEKRAEERRLSTSIQVVDGFPVETIPVIHLSVGMVTGDEVLDNNQLPILPLGIELTEKHIEKLKSLNITEILIRK